ncbi:hypothetical protein E4T56_gene10615 [Termitomyces sp. T112]|nr:hypothetical protein E4T56_gene10615 [Termitomyces sp. T112]KAH0584068.1 hypothetical protein H2248_009641 [Termitomyces sp. 'cryptogamus']KNZ75335.1 hypothetical protein J132_03545 [Termitomyces sp. J132]
MSGRLASFRGPSTPVASPVRVKQSETPNSPSRSSESTYHRKTRTILHELCSIAETWDQLVIIDGLKAAKNLVDARTDLDNDIAAFPDKQPRSKLVGPRLDFMDKCIADLDQVILKLQKQFRRMNAAIDNLEALFFEANKSKGWQWARQEPLWVTWPLEKFVTSVSSILIPYHRSLDLHIELVNSLRSHSISFQESRDIILKWAQQPWLQEDGWDARWEDICAAEVERWNR